MAQGQKVGSYAISTVNFDSWIKEPVITTQHKNKKTRGIKEVKNPCFLEYIEITQDSFWVEKFTNASIGKFPVKFSYRDGVMYYKKGAKVRSLELSNNKYEAAPSCIEFFRVNGGIFSPIDEQNSIALQNARIQSDLTAPLTWGSANKKLQECLISYYVMHMKSSMNLKSNEVEQLRRCILLGIFNKYFGKHNIRIEENHIYSIEGLMWDDEAHIFFIDNRIKPVLTRKYTRKLDANNTSDISHKDMIPQFMTRWQKYVDFLDKKMIRINKQRTNIIQQQPTTTLLSTLTNPSTKDTSFLGSTPRQDSSFDDDDDDDE